jgi:hypothetical protein
MPGSDSSSTPKLPLHMMVTIVGSRELDSVPKLLVDLVHKIDDPMVLLRHPLHGEANKFEQIVAAMMVNLQLPFGWMRPEPGGRSAVYNRDITMVGKSDLVLAFFAGDVMSGGTEHVVEKAMDQWVPVYSYGIRDGRHVLIGSFDPDELFPEMTI